MVAAHEEEMVKKVAEADAKALELYNRSPKKAVKYLTNFSVNEADALFDKWERLDKYVLVKYVDGNIKKQNDDGSFTSYEGRDWTTVSPANKGLSKAYKEAVVKERGPMMKVRDTGIKE